LNNNKNIVTAILKLAIGIGSFLLIWWRLKHDLTADKVELLKNTFSSPTSYLLLLVCIVLIPVNWGIESFKWQLITKSTEPVSLSTAMQSVYSGVCVGNLAPGRATEFLAKIVFFKTENRPAVTILHFLNGMIQLSVTVLIGIICLFMKLDLSAVLGQKAFWALIIFSAVLLLSFVIIFFNFKMISARILQKFKSSIQLNEGSLSLKKKIVLQLVVWSLIRYVVFSSQLILLIKLFYSGNFNSEIFAAIGLYFFLTTALPMISFIEAVVRSAIAILVFEGLNISEIALICVAVMLWLLNIVIPSIVGYIIIIKKKFDLNLFKK
jgi:hypothetical protein